LFSVFWRICILLVLHLCLCACFVIDIGAVKLARY
jgi:hypothetical protein